MEICVVMKKMMKTSQPVWASESESVETAAVVWMDDEGVEYRDGQQGSPMGLKTAGADAPDGAEPMGLKNNPDVEG